MEVAIGKGGQQPESATDDVSALHGSSMQIGNSSVYLALLVGACIVLVVLSIILLVTSRRARKLRKERLAARKQRLKEEMGKTNPFKPIKNTSKAKK